MVFDERRVICCFNLMALVCFTLFYSESFVCVVDFSMSKFRLVCLIASFSVDLVMLECVTAINAGSHNSERFFFFLLHISGVTKKENRANWKKCGSTRKARKNASNAAPILNISDEIILDEIWIFFWCWNSNRFSGQAWGPHVRTYKKKFKNTKHAFSCFFVGFVVREITWKSKIISSYKAANCFLVCKRQTDFFFDCEKK